MRAQLTAKGEPKGWEMWEGIFRKPWKVTSSLLLPRKAFRSCSHVETPSLYKCREILNLRVWGGDCSLGDMCGSTESCCKNGMRQTTPRQDVEFTDLQRADPISLSLCWSLLWTDLPRGNEGLSGKEGAWNILTWSTRASWYLVPYTCPAASYKHCLRTPTHTHTPNVHTHAYTRIHTHRCGDILFVL